MKKIKLTERAANTIKKRLKKEGITQDDFAEDTLEVSYRTLQNYFSGKTAIPLKKLDIIQDFFCMNIVDMFGEVPKGYETTTTTLFNIIKLVLKINIFNSNTPRPKSATKKGFSYYSDKLVQLVHIHPYPVDEPFQVLKCDTSIEKNYYSNISLILESNKIPVGTVFTIGYVLPASPVRVRFDYGTITIKEKSFVVNEVFTSVFSRYEIPLNIDTFEKTGCLLKLATWIGEESITFIIRSSSVTFAIKTENFTEEDIYKREKRGVAIFRRGVWQ